MGTGCGWRMHGPLVVVICSVLASASPAMAQVRLGASLGPSLLFGGPSDLLDGAWGYGLGAAIGLGSSPVSVLVEAGHRGLSDRPDPRAQEIATNALTTLLGGVEVAGGPGPLAFFVNGLAGAVGNNGRLSGPGAPTEGSVGGSWAFGFGASGGLRVRLGDTPVGLELAGRLLRVGDVTLQTTTAAGGEIVTGFGLLGLRGAVTIRLR